MWVRLSRPSKVPLIWAKFRSKKLERMTVELAHKIPLMVSTLKEILKREAIPTPHNASLASDEPVMGKRASKTEHAPSVLMLPRQTPGVGSRRAVFALPDTC